MKRAKRKILFAFAAVMLAAMLFPITAVASGDNHEYTYAYNIYADPNLQGTSGVFHSFSIDFSSDMIADGTYWALSLFRIYVSEESKNLYKDPNMQNGGGYAGLQSGAYAEDADGNRLKNEDGSYFFGNVGIFSIWEMPYQAEDGTQKVLNASRMYPVGAATFGNEGKGMHIVQPYDWEENGWYRMLLHSWEDEQTGTTFMGQWFKNLQTGEWTLFTYYDTHLIHSAFSGEGDYMCFFQENFTESTKYDLRRFKLKNIYAKDVEDDQWKSLNRNTMCYTGGGGGLHNFGSNGEYFWGETGGIVEDQNYYNSTTGNTQAFSINQPNQPDFGTQMPLSLSAEKNDGNDLIVSWNNDATSAPQLSYKVDVYDAGGRKLTSKSATRPEACSCVINNFSPSAYKCVLTITDVYGNTRTQEYKSDNYDSTRAVIYGTGMGNWLNSPNNPNGVGNAPGLTQVQFCPAPWDSSYYKEGLPVTVAMKSKTDSTTTTFVTNVSSVYDAGDWGICRIEPPSTWVPVIGEHYIATFYYRDQNNQYVAQTIDGDYILYETPTYNPVDSIFVNTRPNNSTSYFVGDELNTNGLSIGVNYFNGTTETVNSGFTLSGFNSDTAGKKTVTVFYNGRYTSFDVIVNSPYISFNKDSLTIVKGNTEEISATLHPSAYYVTWSSSDTSIATVSGGKVTGVSIGEAVITAQFNYAGKTYNNTLPVTVIDVAVESISIGAMPRTTTYFIGDAIDTSGLELILNYNNGTTERVNNGFTVQCDTSTEGQKTARVYFGGLTTYFYVTVSTPSITLNRKSLTIVAGSSIDLIATINPSAYYVTWSSTYTIVATVSAGKVTAVAPGRTTVTAQFNYGGKTYSASCNVVVIEPCVANVSAYVKEDGSVGTQIRISNPNKVNGVSCTVGITQQIIFSPPICDSTYYKADTEITVNMRTEDDDSDYTFTTNMTYVYDGEKWTLFY